LNECIFHRFIKAVRDKYEANKKRERNNRRKNEYFESRDKDVIISREMLEIVREIIKNIIKSIRIK
jgi:hypothetical protein